MNPEKLCPVCKGKKVIEGHCECNMEWRGSDGENGWQDCMCEPDHECPECHGKGFVE